MIKSVVAALLAFVASGSSAIAALEDREGLEYFERKIRPVLVQECFACHSDGAKKIRGGLRLDSREGVLSGGVSGPAVLPGKPEESLLLDALRHDGIVMPPKSKLSDAVIHDFERWIRIGAPDPREGGLAPGRAGIDIEAGRAFWSYQPPRCAPVPTVRDESWPITDVDRFILAALEAKKLQPVRDAERATLIRRLYNDLHGLPPSPEDVARFVADSAPDAYERLVDCLISSPRFGERWGRHWLDVARFGESLTLRGFVLKDAWRYRDYVIGSINADLPFDQFLREQVAGDLLPATDLDERRRMMAATTFLAMGNTNLEEQDKAQLEMDVVDEQIDTIGKAFLAQTIGCARCHDHKFDPIPTRDYYALAGILRNAKTLEHANVSKWIERPLPISAEDEVRIRVHEDAITSLEGRIKTARSRSNLGSGGVIAVADLPGVVVDDSKAKAVGEWKASQFSKTYVGDGYIHDINTGKGDKTLTFDPDLPEAGTYEVWLSYPPGANRAPAVPVTVFSADGETTVTVDMRSTPPIDGRFLSLGRYKFERDGQGFVIVSNAGTTGHVVADAVIFLPGDDRPTVAKADEDADRLRKLESELKRLRSSGPEREMVLSVVEQKEIADTRVHIRGSVHNLGELAPRGFLRVATRDNKLILPTDESGRRELAEWLTTETNPLTARVIVNRTWHWVFGEGLVRTVDNFGTTGETPSHPELLDDLAVRFMDEGWSLKRLVRTLVLSHAYRLSSGVGPEARVADPENRLLSHMPRRRLDAESIRDTMLSVSGRLRLGGGGPTFSTDLAADYGYYDNSTLRSVYVPVFRNSLPEVFTLFDFADPSMVVGRREVSTVAPQALFLMNHPFVADQARHAALRLLAEPELDLTRRVERAYQLALGRLPTDAEALILRKFLADGETDEANWTVVFQTLFASADFRYVD